MLELAVEPDQAQLRNPGDAASELAEDALQDRESLFGTSNTWQYVNDIQAGPEDAALEDTGNLTGRLPSPFRASPSSPTDGSITAGMRVVDSGSRMSLSSHQLNREERAVEMNISMRLQEEAAEEQEAIEACASPLQVGATHLLCLLRQRRES